MTPCDICGAPAVIGGLRDGKKWAHCRRCEEAWRARRAAEEKPAEEAK